MQVEMSLAELLINAIAAGNVPGVQFKRAWSDEQATFDGLKKVIANRLDGARAVAIQDALHELQEEHPLFKLRKDLAAATARAEEAEAKATKLAGLLQQIHAALGRGDHGPEDNAACALSAIADLRMECAEERKRAEEAERLRVEREEERDESNRCRIEANDAYTQLARRLTRERDSAVKREPTQEEGDAHEGITHPDGMTFPAGECFVPLGGWTGRRCRYCRRWTWGGPTACLACVERDRLLAERERLVGALRKVGECPDCYGEGTTDDDDSVDPRTLDCDACGGSGLVDDARVALAALSEPSAGVEPPPRMEPHGAMPAVSGYLAASLPTSEEDERLVTDSVNRVIGRCRPMPSQPAGERRFEGVVCFDGIQFFLHKQPDSIYDAQTYGDLLGHRVTLIVRDDGPASPASTTTDTKGPSNEQ